MEFPFNCQKAIGADSEGLAVLDGRRPPPVQANSRYATYGTAKSQVGEILDRMGTASAKA